jgi:hypothetical protein
MGLKSFHYVFVTLSILCLLAFGFWALFTPLDTMRGWGRLGGAFSALFGTALVIYGVWFVRKSKTI